jgi:glucose/arabinose dehydrogenase
MRNVTARVLGLIVMASLLTTAVAQQSVSAAPQPSVKARLVKGGLRQSVSFTFGPGGLIYYGERFSGNIRTLNTKTHTTHQLFKIAHTVGSSSDERGVLGIALHPGWPKVPFIYVYVTRQISGHDINQLIRFRFVKGHVTGSRVLLQGASSASYHNGGRILFGPGGDLFVFVGDNHVDANAQDRTNNIHGKMLRIHSDGSVPKTNPFRGSRIWTYGNRNSFGFTFDPRNGRLWQTENGPGCNDEINLLVRGANYGWGANENCGGTSPGDTNNSGTGVHFPKTFFPSPIGITGDAFCNHCGLPARFEGHLFFGCVNDAKLRVVGLNPARNDISTGPTALFTAPAGIDSMETAPNGAIYFSTANGIYRLVTG